MRGTKQMGVFEHLEISLKPIHAEMDGALAMDRLGQAVVSVFNDVDFFGRTKDMENLPSLVYGNKFVLFTMNDKTV